MINYKITRLEEKSTDLFICINSLNNPVHVEYSFSADERVSKASKEDTIERLLAQLEILDERYVAPEAMISKLEEIKTYTIRPEKVQEHKEKMVQSEVVPIEE